MFAGMEAKATGFPVRAQMFYYARYRFAFRVTGWEVTQSVPSGSPVIVFFNISHVVLIFNFISREWNNCGDLPFVFFFAFFPQFGIFIYILVFCFSSSLHLEYLTVQCSVFSFCFPQKLCSDISLGRYPVGNFLCYLYVIAL